MSANEIIRWCKDVWGKKFSKPESESETTAQNAPEPVGATGTSIVIAAPGANAGATGPSEVQ